MNKKTQTGFRELAPHSLSIQLGCENDCRYCWARHDAVVRFKRCAAEQWQNPVINCSKVNARYGKRDGRIAFPTTHDITMNNLAEYLCVVRKLLAVGNKVLITTKGRYEVISALCEALLDYKHCVDFMFTIGSVFDEVIRFWEPGASNPQVRISCLKYAYYKGYETNVLCEPYLDGFVMSVYEQTIQYITGDFWLGCVKNFKQRVRLDGVTADEMQRYVNPLRILCDDEHIRLIASAFKDKPQVRFKDSVQKVIDKYGV